MPDDYRAVVRAGYDEVAARYLAERPTDGADVALLEDFLGRLPATARVLDAGCGAGVPVTSCMLNRGYPTVGLDISIAQLVLAQDRVAAANAVQGDLTVLPSRDAAFGAVVSYYAVIHVPREDHPSVFAEVCRVLKPGGWTLLCLGARDNAGDHDPESWLGAPMFWSHYDAPTNVRLVREAGLEVVDDRVIDDPMSHGQQLFVLARKPDGATDI